MTYRSVEHAYQAQKTLDIATRIKIAAISNPKDAKQYAKTILLRPTWEHMKVGIM